MHHLQSLINVFILTEWRYSDVEIWYARLQHMPRTHGILHNFPDNNLLNYDRIHLNPCTCIIFFQSNCKISKHDCHVKMIAMCLWVGLLYIHILIIWQSSPLFRFLHQVLLVNRLWKSFEMLDKELGTFKVHFGLWKSNNLAMYTPLTSQASSNPSN